MRSLPDLNKSVNIPLQAAREVGVSAAPDELGGLGLGGASEVAAATAGAGAGADESQAGRLSMPRAR